MRFSQRRGCSYCIYPVDRCYPVPSHAPLPVASSDWGRVQDVLIAVIGLRTGVVVFTFKPPCKSLGSIMTPTAGALCFHPSSSGTSLAVPVK